MGLGTLLYIYTSSLPFLAVAEPDIPLQKWVD
jgi:hypothetical protein